MMQTARESSKTNRCYSAVVEIINYRTGKSRTTVMTGRDRIVNKARGCEFVGVMAQFRDGEPTA
jgi:hypothetical protein